MRAIIFFTLFYLTTTFFGFFFAYGIVEINKLSPYPVSIFLILLFLTTISGLVYATK